jgi:hypothetical protein
MPHSRKNNNALVEGAEKTAAIISGFDYGIHPEDFVFYELHRLIEEDRASFDDAEFRILIDEGIRAHIEDNLVIRARLAGILRASGMKGETQTVALRVIHALEDVEADLCNVALLVRNYTGYLLSRLESLDDTDPASDRIATAADFLFESTGDRGAAETALEVLIGSRSPISARVLAHAISEPLLDEDLEARAYEALKASWPSPRHYMLYNLREHPHEDIPIRWFQLFVEVDEPKTVDLALDELRAHSENPRYQEDLLTLMEMLKSCGDPEIEDKVLDAVNSPATNAASLPLLRKFLEEYQPQPPESESAWAVRSRAFQLNRAYRNAAALFERGESEKAREALDKILAEDAGYPLAAMLKQLAEKRA